MIAQCRTRYTHPKSKGIRKHSSTKGLDNPKSDQEPLCESALDF